jgi:hypothetical protein
MWERWMKGEPLHQIARLFDRPHTSIRQILAESGGIRAPVRSRSKLALTLAEREEISRSLVAGQSIRALSATLARAPSAISREIAHNGGASCYRAAQADQAAWQRAHRPKAVQGPEPDARALGDAQASMPMVTGADRRLASRRVLGRPACDCPLGLGRRRPCADRSSGLRWGRR